MKFFPAKLQSRKDVLGYSFPSLRLRGKKFFAIAIALSFFALLLPIAGVSASSMSCCAGKTAGHCDSGIAAKKPPPKEPMCGQHEEVAEDDSITIVAESSHAESHQPSASSSSQPAAQRPSLSKPCRMECGTCTTASTRQQKRERAIAPAETRAAAPLAPVSHSEILAQLFSSNNYRIRINPRGPPSFSIQ
jgi:hypothetical protein